MEWYLHFSICIIACCLIQYGDSCTLLYFVLYVLTSYLLPVIPEYFLFGRSSSCSRQIICTIQKFWIEISQYLCIFMWNTKKTKGKLQLRRSHLMSWPIRRIHGCSACRRLWRSHITIWGEFVCNGLASGKCLVSTLIRLAVIPVKI